MEHLKYAVGLTLSKPFPFFLINIPDFERTPLRTNFTMRFILKRMSIKSKGFHVPWMTQEPMFFEKPQCIQTLGNILNTMFTTTQVASELKNSFAILPPTHQRAL